MTGERPAYSAFAAGQENIIPAGQETNGDRSSGAARYDGGLCRRAAPDEQRGVRGGALPEENCITCGDIAVEVRVVRLLADDLADVDTGEGTERVSVALVSVRVGDTVLVHAGEAIAVVGK
jgi:hydrogenase expression/formation protein HypC